MSPPASPPADGPQPVERPVVDHPAALAELVGELAGASVIALDTEFHAERRYRPELMLVQLSADGGPVATIDPLAVDLGPLHAVLDGCTWLAHGASWDVALLHAATGARPGQLLDTQLLAGMAGRTYPARLGDLVHGVLGETVDKSATLSNWRTRPLSSDQLAYARADVALLAPLAKGLIAELDTLDRVQAGSGAPPRSGHAWAIAAGDELVAAALADPDPDDQWQRLDIAPRLDGPTRQALQALFRWRETEAERRNSPPHYVLSPSIALDLARRRPTDLDGLRANRRIPAGLVKRHGVALLGALAAGRRAAGPPPAVPAASHGLRAMLEAWASVIADSLRIAPRLLAPRSVVHQVATEGLAGLSGWRAEAMGPQLERFLAGDELLGVRDGRVERVPRRGGSHGASHLTGSDRVEHT